MAGRRVRQQPQGPPTTAAPALAGAPHTALRRITTEWEAFARAGPLAKLESLGNMQQIINEYPSPAVITTFMLRIADFYPRTGDVVLKWELYQMLKRCRAAFDHLRSKKEIFQRLQRAFLSNDTTDRIITLRLFALLAPQFAEFTELHAHITRALGSEEETEALAAAKTAAIYCRYSPHFCREAFAAAAETMDDLGATPAVRVAALALLRSTATVADLVPASLDVCWHCIHSALPTNLIEPLFTTIEHLVLRASNDTHAHIHRLLSIACSPNDGTSSSKHTDDNVHHSNDDDSNDDDDHHHHHHTAAVAARALRALQRISPALGHTFDLDAAARVLDLVPRVGDDDGSRDGADRGDGSEGDEGAGEGLSLMMRGSRAGPALDVFADVMNAAAFDVPTSLQLRALDQVIAMSLCASDVHTPLAAARVLLAIAQLQDLRHADADADADADGDDDVAMDTRADANGGGAVLPSRLELQQLAVESTALTVDAIRAYTRQRQCSVTTTNNSCNSNSNITGNSDDNDDARMGDRDDDHEEGTERALRGAIAVVCQLCEDVTDTAAPAATQATAMCDAQGTGVVDLVSLASATAGWFSDACRVHSATEHARASRRGHSKDERQRHRQQRHTRLFASLWLSLLRFAAGVPHVRLEQATLTHLSALLPSDDKGQDNSVTAVSCDVLSSLIRVHALAGTTATVKVLCSAGTSSDHDPTPALTQLQERIQRRIAATVATPWVASTASSLSETPAIHLSTVSPSQQSSLAPSPPPPLPHFVLNSSWSLYVCARQAAVQGQHATAHALFQRVRMHLLHCNRYSDDNDDENDNDDDDDAAAGVDDQPEQQQQQENKEATTAAREVAADKRVSLDDGGVRDTNTTYDGWLSFLSAVFEAEAQAQVANATSTHAQRVSAEQAASLQLAATRLNTCSSLLPTALHPHAGSFLRGFLGFRRGFLEFSSQLCTLHEDAAQQELCVLDEDAQELRRQVVALAEATFNLDPTSQAVLHYSKLLLDMAIHALATRQRGDGSGTCVFDARALEGCLALIHPLPSAAAIAHFISSLHRLPAPEAMRRIVRFCVCVPFPYPPSFFRAEPDLSLELYFTPRCDAGNVIRVLHRDSLMLRMQGVFRPPPVNRRKRSAITCARLRVSCQSTKQPSTSKPGAPSSSSSSLSTAVHEALMDVTSSHFFETQLHIPFRGSVDMTAHVFLEDAQGDTLYKSQPYFFKAVDAGQKRQP
ncbi:hypothetical protein PTSG_02288 [Salpingoeca rosetta]|uniref:Integrator complex subunit 7 N-terminal domain-containing protein n=1 Tax=Salpingoeca rosetta (strain ATCC 50818 / BSB-021) TaxID=946362 RepID=F2U1S1_SALR5|nr:uncharacterized protein PTSG_02288 [Salpingoeca rosetta]EGD81573.1 hypothetical protein PTSG_02288 [Salpingoeca rosetta]|eukprot:XP_004996777.1 hypothetical protein PTSG_02288 [Salpingoeca rosetta]